MSADLTGSHLDAATGRDEPIVAAGKGDDGDSDDDDDDDDDRDAARQARAAATKGGGGSGEKRTGADGTGSAGAQGEGGNGEGEGSAVMGQKPDKEMPRNKLVRSFFRGLLKEWEMDLNARPDHVKRTVQGKLETKTQKQAKDYMRPLFKLCKHKVGCGTGLVLEVFVLLWRCCWNFISILICCFRCFPHCEP